MDNGWIKLHRKLLDWEWYSDLPTRCVFIHLLLTTNHKDKKHRGTVVKKGQLLTGRDLLAIQTGLTVRQVRTALSHLKSTNEVVIKSTNKGTIITLVNWDLYQMIDCEVTSKTTNKPTSNRPATDQQPTTNKNVKKEKNMRNKEIIYRSIEHLFITKDEIKTLIAKNFSKEKIDDILDRIEEYSDSPNFKKYRKLYNVALKWLNRDKKKQQEEESRIIAMQQPPEDYNEEEDIFALRQKGFGI